MEKIEHLLEKIKEEIDQLDFGHEPKELYEPISYLMSLGGKRMRPLLVLLAYQLKKNDLENILTPSLAVEVFHNFTLMHDDIMDNAPIRRGKPTVHEKWNDNIAILSGDTMMVIAYEMIMQVSPTYLPSILKKFNKCAIEVCEGQQLDMNFETRNSVSESEYLEMIRLKTAVLLGFSLEMGGVLAGFDEESTSLLRDFGINIGIGFQLKDDLLDVYGDKEKFGKQVGGDIVSNKKTFLLINALLKASSSQKDELEKWINKEKFEVDEKVGAVTSIYDELGIREMTIERIDDYFAKGFKSLEKMKISSDKKQPLIDFTNYLINREK